MPRTRMIVQSFRVREELLMRLKDLADADGVGLPTYLQRLVEDHCKATSAIVVDRGDRPDAEQYTAYCNRLELLYAALDGILKGSTTTRARTKFNKWVASVAGANSIQRTTEQWDELFREVERFGDVYGENSTPKMYLAMEIENAANKMDWLSQVKTQEQG